MLRSPLRPLPLPVTAHPCPELKGLWSGTQQLLIRSQEYKIHGKVEKFTVKIAQILLLNFYQEKCWFSFHMSCCWSKGIEMVQIMAISFTTALHPLPCTLVCFLFIFQVLTSVSLQINCCPHTRTKKPIKGTNLCWQEWHSPQGSTWCLHPCHQHQLPKASSFRRYHCQKSSSPPLSCCLLPTHRGWLEVQQNRRG